MTWPGPSPNLFRPPTSFNFRDAAAALIVLDDGRYLMQLRDDKPGIFFPAHWGLFGGALDPGEDAEQALRRELKEEIGYDTAALTYFTRLDFGFEPVGFGRVMRAFYEVRMEAGDLDALVLTEGRALEAIGAEELLLGRPVVPYDAFAIWMHHCWVNGAWADQPAKPN